MFAADEVKRQYGELEDKYRLLENEFTEKAENEVNSRKAKERIELQFTLAKAEIASLANEKESLVGAVKRTEAGISKLEFQLDHTQRAYEDMLQQERSRLETNKHIGTQHSPMLHDVHVQTSFKTPEMTLRQVNSFDHVPHRRKGFGSITPSVAGFI
jgi:chromosome segregation ATPase